LAVLLKVLLGSRHARVVDLGLVVAKTCQFQIRLNLRLLRLQIKTAQLEERAVAIDGLPLAY
jgi:hypothetical protein